MLRRQVQRGEREYLRLYAKKAEKSLRRLMLIAIGD